VCRQLLHLTFKIHWSAFNTIISQVYAKLRRKGLMDSG
jgi:hypothetical protein